MTIPRACWRWMLALCLPGVAGPAQAQATDPRFPVTAGEVSSQLVVGDTLYVSGWFQWIGKANGSAVALDATTGVPVTPWPRIHWGPKSGTSTNWAYATAAVPDGEGGFHVGGTFDKVSGVPRAGLAHIRADGSLDAWGPPVNGDVKCMALAEGTLYVGGRFTAVGGQPRQGLAAVDVATGAVTSWNPQNAEYTQIEHLAVDEARVFVAGYLTTIGGQSRSRLAAVDRVTGLATGFAPQPNEAVYSLSLGDGVLYAGGGFTSIGGRARRFVAALDPFTGAAFEWDALADGTVSCVAASGPTVYLSGAFTHLGGLFIPLVGAVDATTGLPTAWRPDLGYWNARTIVPAGPVVYLGGQFERVGSARRMHLAAVDSATGVPTPWNPGASGLVESISVSGSRVLVCGPMAGSGGITCSGLAAVDLETGIPLPWHPELDTLQMRIALASDGQRLYAGGAFRSVDGQSRRGLAAFDRASGQLSAWNPAGATQNRVTLLATDGASVFAYGDLPSLGYPGPDRLAAADVVTGLPTAWSPTWTSSNQYLRGPLGMLAAHGRVYINGTFDTVNGQSRRGIVAVDPATGALLPWNPNIVGTVVGAAVLDTTLYMCGGFSSVGGLPRDRYAAVGAAGAQPTGWLPEWSLSGPGLAASPMGVTVVLFSHQWYWQGQYPKNTVIAHDPVTGTLLDWFPGIWVDAGWGIVAGVTTHGDDVIVCGAQDMVGGDYYRAGLVRVRPADTNPPAVEWLTQVAGESFVIGSHHALAWHATDDHAIASCDVWLSRGGPSGPWELLAAGVSDAESYDWRVTPPAASGDCWLRVDARDEAGHVASSYSAGPFSIAYTTSVPAGEALGALALHAPAPNPARGPSTIGFALPTGAHVRLAVVDLQGREVAVLVDGERAAGQHLARLPAGTMPPGLYFVRLQAAGETRMRRVVVFL